MTLPSTSHGGTLPFMDESDHGPYDRGGELEAWARSIAATEAIRRENEDTVLVLGDSFWEGGGPMGGMLAEIMLREDDE